MNLDEKLLEIFGPKGLVTYNKNTRTTLTYFTPFSSISIVDFEQVNVSWVQLGTVNFFKGVYRMRISSKAYSGLRQTCKLNFFAEIVNGFEPSLFL